MGQTEKGLGAIGRARSCGEVGGTGAEVVFPWSVRSPVSSPLSFSLSSISSHFLSISISISISFSLLCSTSPFKPLGRAPGNTH